MQRPERWSVVPLRCQVHTRVCIPAWRPKRSRPLPGTTGNGLFFAAVPGPLAGRGSTYIAGRGYRTPALDGVGLTVRFGRAHAEKRPGWRPPACGRPPGRQPLKLKRDINDVGGKAAPAGAALTAARAPGRFGGAYRRGGVFLVRGSVRACDTGALCRAPV